MAIEVVQLSRLIEKDVFTSQGMYCGQVRDIRVDLDKFRVNSLIVNAVRGSYLSRIIGEKKGVVIPYSAVLAIGDIVIIRDIFKSVGNLREQEESSLQEKATIEVE